MIHRSSLDINIRHSPPEAGRGSGPIYQDWVGRVARLGKAARELEPVTQQMKLPAAESFAWHGNLFQKLLPQLAKEPFLIVGAIAGG